MSVEKPQHQSHNWQAHFILVVLALLLLWLLDPRTMPTPPIQSNTARWVTQYAQMGDGWISQAKWSPDGQTVAIAGSLGVWLYDAERFDMPPRLLDGHTTPVRNIAYHPTRPLLVSGAEDGTIALWNMETGERLGFIQGHQSRVTMLVFSPDENTLASFGEDQSFAIWDIHETDLQLRYRNQHNLYIQSIAFHPVNEWVALYSGTAITVYETMTGEIITNIPIAHELYIQKIMFSEDGLQLVAGRTDVNFIEYTKPITAIWHINGNHFERVNEEANSDTLSSVTIAYYTRLDFAVIPQYSVPVAASLSQIMQRTTYSMDYEGTFSPDGTRLLRRYYDEWVIWDLPRQTILHSLFDTLHVIGDIFVRPDGEEVVSTGGYVWSSSGSAQQTIKVISSGQAVFYDSGTPFMITITEDIQNTSPIRLWNMTTGELTREYPQNVPHYTNITVSPDHQLMAVATAEIITVWQLINDSSADEDELPLVVLPVAQQPFSPLLFSEDHQLLFTRSQSFECNCILVGEWNLTTGAMVRELQVPEDFGILTLSQSGNLLAYSDAENNVHLLNRVSQEETIIPAPRQEMLGEVSAIEFNAQEDALVVAGVGGAVHLWSLPEQRLVSELGIGTRSSSGTTFSPDGTLLAVGTVAGHIMLVDTATGVILNTLEGHKGYILSLQFSADGTTLASAGWDGTVRLWRVGHHLAAEVTPDDVLMPTWTPAPTHPAEIMPTFIPLTPTPSP